MKVLETMKVGKKVFNLVQGKNTYAEDCVHRCERCALNNKCFSLDEVACSNYDHSYFVKA